MKNLFILPILFLCSTGLAQIDLSKIPKEIPVIEMPAVDNDELIARYDSEKKQKGTKALRFAHDFETNITLEDDFLEWGDNKKSRYFILGISSRGAHSINLGFESFHLPKGAEMFILEKEQWLGPFAKEKPYAPEYWTPIIQDDMAVIQIKIPSEKVNEAKIRIHRVNHDFRGFSAVASGSCNVDVICGAADGYPEIDNYRDLIRSVGVYSVNGTFFCSGALINTADQSCKPYFLTANHCVDEFTNYNSVVVYWNYENSTCRPPGSPESGATGDGKLDQFNSGATLSSTNGISDYTLFELDGEIDPSINAFLAGWDRQRRAPTMAIAIHHPNTDEKRISFEFDPLTISDYLSSGNNINENFLRVDDWDIGTTEGGSSGSPLFNSSGQIVGQLSGGFAACGNDDADWYGLMASNFEKGTSNQDLIGAQLDPLNSGAITITGVNYNSCELVQVSSENIIDQVCSIEDTLIFRIFNNSLMDSAALQASSTSGNPSFIWSRGQNLQPGDSTDLYITNLQNIPLGQNFIDITNRQAGLFNNFQLSYQLLAMPSAPAILQPADGTVIFPSILLDWNPVQLATAYELEYSLMEDFSDSTSLITSDDEYRFSNLPPGEELFIRLRSINRCGTSPWTLGMYIIEDIECMNYELSGIFPIQDLQTLEIPIEVQIDNPLASIEVKKIKGMHSWTSDLITQIYFDTDRSIELFNGECAFFQDFDLGFSDMGLNDLDCPLTSGDLYKPVTPFSSWVGSSNIDTIWLSIEDTESIDEGELQYINLEICYQAERNGFVTTDFEVEVYQVDSFTTTLEVDERFFNGSNDIELRIEAPSEISIVQAPNVFTNFQAELRLETNLVNPGIYPIRCIAQQGQSSDTMLITLNVLECLSYPMLRNTDDTIYTYYHQFGWENVQANAEYEIIIGNDRDLRNGLIYDIDNTIDTQYLSTSLAMNQKHYWSVKPIGACILGEAEVDSFWTSIDYSISLSQDSFEICPQDSAIVELQIGQRFFDQFNLNIIDQSSNDFNIQYDSTSLYNSNRTTLIFHPGQSNFGTYDFLIEIEDSIGYSVLVPINIELVEPGPKADLINPKNNEGGVDLMTSFQWMNTSDQSTLQISLDTMFNNLILEQDVSGINIFRLNSNLQELTDYYWRVSNNNDCGSAVSDVFRFRTTFVENNFEANQLVLSIYPNPVHDFLNIKTDLVSDKLTYTIFNVLGKTVVQGILEVNNSTLNVSALHPGAYFIRLTHGDRNLDRKFIKD